MDAETLINVLRETGRRFDLRISEIAALSGYSKSLVWRWHQPKDNRIDLHQFCDWASALGYEVTLVRKKEKYAAPNVSAAE